ncbi:MAG: winged helix-turn-helix transcriptional regulator [Solirubrobacterales bacterium]
MALSLLAAPLNVHILQTLEQEPKALLDLRQAVGSPPQSTMRLYSRTLTELGIVDRRRRSEFPGSADYELTQTGQELLGVAKVLEGWLNVAPTGPISLGSIASKSATKALVEGWSTNIIRAIAAQPLSLTELNQVIPKVSYPSLERRLGSMRLAGLVESQPSERRGTPYAATNWLRRAVIPMTSAAAWERRHRPLGAQPIGRLGVEAVFLLAIPQLEMPSTFTGRFRLAVEVQGGSAPIFAGVLVCFEEGVIVSCSSRLQGEADAWVSGSPDAWLRRMSGITQGGLEIRGDIAAAEDLLDALEGISNLSSRWNTDPV